MTTVQESIQALRALMDKNGLFPADWVCQQCGKPLNADGYHPAELHAGTYNGLCYDCTRKGPYVVAVSGLDGALSVSWPPSCPSHRRDRESRVGYEGCPHCEGLGATRKHANWSTYWEQCPHCKDRYYNHPSRVWAERRRATIYKVAESCFHDALRQACGLPRRVSKRRLTSAVAQMPAEEVRAIRRCYLAAYERLNARFTALLERRAKNFILRVGW